MTNIVLTGFMGTGKSTIGRAVAQLLGREFVDTDALIVERHGEIEAIFATLGEQAFRAMERNIATELADRGDLVVATGGRFMLDPHNRDALAESVVLRLTATEDEIVRRVTADGIEHRPLLADADDPRAVVVDLLREREAAYAAFPSIETTDRTVEEIAADVVSAAGLI